jgi:hypothetical protein
MPVREIRRENVRPAGYRQPSRRFPSLVVRSNGEDGPYAAEAETGWEQGEWTWVRNRRREALGPEQDGRNGQRQGNVHGGLDYSPKRQDYYHGRDYYRNRSVSRGRMRVAPSKVRVFHERDRGRSLTYRYGRPFYALEKVWLDIG